MIYGMKRTIRLNVGAELALHHYAHGRNVNITYQSSPKQETSQIPNYSTMSRTRRTEGKEVGLSNRITLVCLQWWHRFLHGHTSVLDSNWYSSCERLLVQLFRQSF